MSHPPHVKAAAMVALMTGDTVGHVARTRGIPKQTVSRWRVDADALFGQIVRSSPELLAVGAMLRELLPGLSQQNGSKKRARVR